MGEAVEQLSEESESEALPVSMVGSKSEEQRLREFGVLMATVLAAVSAFLMWKGRPSCFYTLLAAAAFLIPAFLAPKILAPIEKAWMVFGEIMSVIMTTILLVLTYYLVMTPMGFLMKVLGKDLLDIKLDKDTKSYWKGIEPDGPHTRPFLPY